MRRLLVTLAFSLVALLSPAVCTLQAAASDDWTGGNGWCRDGICFRAWPTSQGVEIRWRIESGSCPGLVVTRQQLQPFLQPTPTVIATRTGIASSTAQEFVHLDVKVTPGAIYRYELVRSEDGQPLGEPLEAGIPAQASPTPHPHHTVFLPLTLRR